MLTKEQYHEIMISKVNPIVSACITTKEKCPDAVVYHGLTNSTLHVVYAFHPDRVKEMEPLVIDVFRDLPRTYGGISSYGYVAFEDFFSDVMEQKRKQKEMLLANAFINLSAHLQLVFPRRVAGTGDYEKKVVAVNCELQKWIPTRKEYIIQKEFEERRKNQPR